jgi:hypothetical protein
MAVRVQVTVDCADPDGLARFWAAALHYELEEPPDGSASWTEYYRARGVPEEELDESIEYDSIVDPAGVGPRFWFQKVPEAKVVKNRLHLDLDVTDRRSGPVAERRTRVDAEAARLTALGATLVRVMEMGGPEYYAVTMRDPEGNEFCLS